MKCIQLIQLYYVDGFNINLQTENIKVNTRNLELKEFSINIIKQLIIRMLGNKIVIINVYPIVFQKQTQLLQLYVLMRN
ncbi:hypothetical protein pb186bvf_019578 [Paramecium bursaria]